MSSYANRLLAVVFASFRPSPLGCRAVLLSFLFRLLLALVHAAIMKPLWWGGPNKPGLFRSTHEAYIPSCPHWDKHTTCNNVRNAVSTSAYCCWKFTWCLSAIFLGTITCQPCGVSFHIHLIRQVRVEGSAISAGKSRNVLSYRATIVGPARSRYTDFQACRFSSPAKIGTSVIACNLAQLAPYIRLLTLVTTS